MGKSKTKNQKKLRATADHTAEEEFSSVPHSFVFHRGQIGKNTQQLILDVRRAMEPFTATSLKVRKKNALKDFVAVAGPLGVTHFLIFSKTPASVNFKFVRLPRGPTLSFKVTQYALMKDVVSTLKKHRMHEQQFTQPPLLVLNNFGTQGMQVKLMATMFQNMFPSINVHKVNLNTIKRCILINYNSDTQLIDFRHYSLKVVPVGMSKGMKKLLQEKFPNMSRWDDISELLIKGANLSESEAEQDGDHNITELPQAYAGRGNMKAQQSAVRLTEIGPRMTLQLVKIEEGLSDGKVLYHNYIEKTEEQIKGMLERKEKKLRQKAERRKKQEGDVKNKKQERDDNKKRSLAGMKRKCGADQDDDSGAEDPGTTGEQDQSEDDDAEYYRQEVGQEPDRDLFLHGSRKKFPNRNSGPPRKKFRGATEPRRAGQESHSPGGPTGQRRGKSPLQRGDKSPWGQKPRPGKKPMGQKAWQNPEGERPRPGKRPMGQKAWQNPEGQRPRPGKKPVGQKGRQNAEGQRPRKNAATRGFKKNFEFKRPGAFGSRSSRPGQKPKAGGRHKTGERKGGKPPKQKRKGF